MLFTLPADCVDTLFISTFSIESAKDRVVFNIMIRRGRYLYFEEKQDCVNNPHHTIYETPHLSGDRVLLLDKDYYYMHGRTRNAFIMMLDKKSEIYLPQFNARVLTERFKAYAQKIYGLEHDEIYALTMLNFHPAPS